MRIMELQKRTYCAFRAPESPSGMYYVVWDEKDAKADDWWSVLVDSLAERVPASYIIAFHCIVWSCYNSSVYAFN